MRASVGEPVSSIVRTIAFSIALRSPTAAGGITTLASLPETKTAIDDTGLVQLCVLKGEETGRFDLNS